MIGMIFVLCCVSIIYFLEAFEDQQKSLDRLQKIDHNVYGPLFVYRNDYIPGQILQNDGNSTWEERWCEIIASHYVPGTDVLDVGANIGLTSLRVHQLRQVTGTFHMFECQPDIFAMLEYNTINLPRKLYNVALSDKDNIIALKHVYDDTGRTSVEIDSRDSQILQVTTFLDKFNLQTKISVMKVDIEGHEYEFLIGARATIELNLPVICMEIKNEATFGLMEQFGYKNVYQHDTGEDFVFVHNSQL